MDIIPHEIKGDCNEVILEDRGEVVYVRVGNTVIEVVNGYNNTPEIEPCAIVKTYPFEDDHKSRVLIYDDKDIVLSKNN